MSELTAKIDMRIIAPNPLSNAYEKAQEAKDLLIKRLGVHTPSKQRVLLINPLQIPIELYDPELHEKKRYFNYPPYGLGIVTSAIEEVSDAVHILDLNHTLISSSHRTAVALLEQEAELLFETIKQFMPTIVGISAMFTLTHTSLKRTAEALRKMKFRGLITIGGVYVSNDTTRVLRDIKEIDIAFPRESEEEFAQFLAHLSQESVKETTNDLNIHRSPNYLDLKIDQYSASGEIGAYRFLWTESTVAATIQSNRGCRARCTFCSVEKFNGKGVRSRTIHSVIEELKYLVNDYGINHIMWLDDDLFFTESRAIELFNAIVKAGIRITWDASNGIIASAITEPILQAASESGCIGMHIGIESGSDRVLRAIRKPSGRRHYINAGNLLKKYSNIFTKGFLIIGFPNETRGEIEETITLAQEMDLDWYTVSLLTPLPSTDIYNQMVELGLISPQEGDTTSVNYGSMQTGTQKRIEENAKTNLSNHRDLSDFSTSEIIPMSELKYIWFEVDFRINYQKKISDFALDKLRKRHIFLNDIDERMTLGRNPLVLYHRAACHSQLGNFQEAKGLQKLANKMQNSSLLWEKRLTKFGIGV